MQRAAQKILMISVHSPSCTYTVEAVLSLSERAQTYRCSSSISHHHVVLRVEPRSECTVATLVIDTFQTRKSLSHANIPVFVEWFELPDQFCIAYEFIEGISLSTLISRDGPLPEDRARCIFLQLLDVLSYLHDLGFGHRNLSPNHMILDSKFHVKIIGWSHLTTIHKLPATVEKDPLTIFDPPEALAKAPTLGMYFDCWSIGVILFFMISGREPWKGESPADLYYAMQSGVVQKPAGMTLSAYNLILKFMDLDPLKRCTPSQAGSNYWVAGVRSGPPGTGSRSTLLNSTKLIRLCARSQKTINPPQQKEIYTGGPAQMSRAATDDNLKGLLNGTRSLLA
jgi:carbon catabolite-derepressing protein kinase